MMRLRALALVVLVIAAPVAQEQRPTFQTTSAVVVLDIVVRDRKGQPVRDLRPDEIIVQEDGQRRDLVAFRLVEGRASEDRVTGPTAGHFQPDASRQVSLVTFVFDKLMDGRQLAERAALDFLANTLQPPGGGGAPPFDNVYMSVFTIDQRLVLRQPFTQDAYLLKQAILHATRTTSVTAASLAGTANQQERLAEQSTAIAARAADAAAASGPTSPGTVNPGTIGGASAEAQMAAVVTNILRFSDNLQRQQQAQSSLYPLLAMAKAQGRLAGRKTVLYFSEGLQVPRNLEEVFRTTISEANRANVTVYAIDARGLNASRDSEAARDQLLQAARTSAQQMARRGAGAVTVDEVMIAENAESSLRANVQATLGELAQETGGFLISDTNDFRKPMQRVAGDIGSYYEAAYVPVNPDFDGKFRRISVAVSRPGVTVQARSGYFALPPGEGSALLPFELSLLTALTVPEPPKAFPYQAAAFRFQPSGDLREHLVVIEVPLSGMAFQEDKRRKVYRLHVALLALVKDTDGRLVERFSDDYPFEGPLERLEGIRRGNLIFKRRLALPPGKYMLETVAQDRDTQRTSVMKSALTVPHRSELAVSSLAMIRRVEPAGDGAPADDPLLTNGVRIVPNLDVPISLAANQQLSAYFVVYTRPEAVPQAALDFVRDGKVIARAAPELPPADTQGRIPYVVTFPTSSFAAGRYEIRVAVRQGTSQVEESTWFTVVP
jgi:VWFA-related protein